MGKRRKKPRNRGRERRKPAAGESRVPSLLAEAVRRGKRGDAEVAMSLAREAHDAAASPIERRAVEAVLGEAHLHAAFAAADPDATLAHLADAIRFDPDSARLRYYRGLALLRAGRIQEGTAALEQSLDTTGQEPVPGSATYARQLANLTGGESWSTAGLAEAEAGELWLVAHLLGPGSVRPENDPDDDAAQPEQMPLFRRQEPKRWTPAGALEAIPAAARPAWQAMLALAADPEAAPVEELREAAARRGPEPVRACLRYYQGVAALRRGDREEALRLWGSAARAERRTPWFEQNLVALLREKAQEFVEGERWRELANLGASIPAGIEDRILAETVALAHDHLGHEAALKGQWSKAAGHWRQGEVLHSRRTMAHNLALAEEALGNWGAAAAAWRAMARRRPRKADHPDYLPDAQVATLWRQAADCYERTGDKDQELACVENAMKYAPDEESLRFRKAELLLERGSWEDAGRELDNLLGQVPRHKEALVLRAMIEGENPNGDPASLWRRVLEVTPNDSGARDALAEWHLRQVETGLRFLWGSQRPRPLDEQMRMLRQALDEVAGHPRIMAALGQVYAEAGERTEAEATLLRAIDAAPKDSSAAGELLHGLLHRVPLEEELIGTVLARVRRIPGLHPTFWIEQAEEVLECDLGEVWFERFLQEALELVGEPDVYESWAAVLYHAYEAARAVEAEDLARRVEARIREEAPESGAIELIEAERLLYDHDDMRGARSLFKTAGQRARRAGDEALRRIILDRERETLSGLEELARLFGRM